MNESNPRTAFIFSSEANDAVRPELESSLLAQSDGSGGRSGVCGAAGDAQGSDVADILTERGQRYGKFINHADVTQRLKMILRNHMGAKWYVLADDQKEALEMIAHKLARIVNGDPDYADSWIDIAGYAKLVADRLQGVER